MLKSLEKPMTKQVQLTGAGPFQMPAVEGFLGLGIDQDQALAQMIFLLEGGVELHVPIAELALGRVLSVCAEMHRTKTETK